MRPLDDAFTSTPVSDAPRYATSRSIGLGAEPIGQTPAADTVPGNISTAFSISLGSPASGYVNTAGDQDWYRATLTAGTTYTIALDSGGSLDPYLRIINSAGSQLLFDDDSGAGTNSYLTFTPGTTDTYYISAQGYQTSTGAYTLGLDQVPVYTVPQISNQLLNDFWIYWGEAPCHWSDTSLTYNVQGLSAARADIARLAFATWQDVCGLTFTETTGSAQITVDDNDTSGVAYGGPNLVSGQTILSASINVSPNWYGSLSTMDSYTFQTFIHEIGHTLGLGHGGNYDASAPSGIAQSYANDTWQYSIMSYFEQEYYGGASTRFVMTPQMADIYAANQYYGAGTARATDTVYGFNVSGHSATTAAIYAFASYSSAPAFTIYDSGGADTLDCSGYSANQRINLVGGGWSDVGGLIGNIGIYTTSVVENANGGTGGDTLIGNASNNRLDGRGGNDNLQGGGGRDVLIGDSGADTAIYTGNSGSFSLLSYNGTTAVLTNGSEGQDRLQGVENIQFANTTVASSTATAFNGYEYLASYADLRTALGADLQSAFDHYINWGFTEGRSLDSFDNYSYLASYPDLLATLGAGINAAAQHFVATGAGQGRVADAFDEWQYTASYGDLINAFGTGVGAAARHYVTYGYNEGRVTDAFDEWQYVASYGDLINAFGTNVGVAARHYVSYGHSEGRLVDSFAEWEYLASYTDLISAFGADAGAGVQHYVTTGFNQGRARDAFNDWEYLASHDDLIQALGANETAAAHHYVAYGFNEGRSLDSFDGAQYIANYADLQAAFGGDLNAAAYHYVHYGFAEGRTDAVLTGQNPLPPLDPTKTDYFVA